jgi:glycosyltransferase involved in cell wall biosynthesis
MSVVTGAGTTEPTQAGVHLLQRIPSSIRVLRASRPPLNPSYRLFPRVDGNFVNSLTYFRVVEQTLSSDPPSVVMASGPNFQTFIAAYYIARYFRIPLVLEYRDEWTESPFSFVRLGNADRAWETRCLRRADLVIFTTQSQLERNVARFAAGHSTRSVVIPNGWEPDDFVVPEESSAAATEDARALISFVGTLGDHTPPGAFLETLGQALRGDPALARRLRIRFVGMKSDRSREQLAAFPMQELIDQLDHMLKPDANRMMTESSALLLLNEVSLHRYLPGKIYDYLASGAPILVFGEGGEVAKLVEELDAGIVVPLSDPAALADALHKIVSWPKRSGEGNTNRSEWLSRHTRACAARHLFDVLSSMGASVSQRADRSSVATSL